MIDEGKFFLIQYGHRRTRGNIPQPDPADPEREPRNSKTKKVLTMIREIEIKDGAQVERINRLAAKTPYEVWLSSGTMMLDARSLLGLFALVGKKAHVVAEDNVNPKEFSKLVAKMA